MEAGETVPTADRAGILDATGVELDSTKTTRPPSVMYAQALALRSTFAGAAKVIEIIRRADVEPAARLFMLEALAVTIEAGVVQCDSFLVMAEAMSAMLPSGARPSAPTTPSQPKVFGGARKNDGRSDAGNGG